MQKIYYRLYMPLLLTILCTASASAQWSIGVDGGVSFNTLQTGRSYDYDRNYDSKTGFTVGIPVRYDFKDWLGLQTEVAVMQKNYKMHRSAIYRYNYYDYTNTFLNIPVMARFSFGGRNLRGYMLAGGYVGGWLKSHVKGAQNQYFLIPETTEDRFGKYKFDEDVKFDSRRDNRFDGGLVAGLGLQYSISREIGVFAEGRYYYALTDMQKNYMKGLQGRYNNTITISLGVIYTFRK